MPVEVHIETQVEKQVEKQVETGARETRLMCGFDEAMHP